MKRSPVVDAVLTPDMYKWLRKGVKPSTYVQEVTEVPLIVVRPTPRSRSNIVIKATIAGETPKAYNFKVLLNSSKYNVKFPFAPSLYIWMPKSCVVEKLDHDYYEVNGFIGKENLNKAFVSLKKKLVDAYNFESTEIIEIREIHLL